MEVFFTQALVPKGCLVTLAGAKGDGLSVVLSFESDRICCRTSGVDTWDGPAPTVFDYADPACFVKLEQFLSACGWAVNLDATPDEKE